LAFLAENHSILSKTKTWRQKRNKGKETVSNKTQKNSILQKKTISNYERKILEYLQSWKWQEDLTISIKNVLDSSGCTIQKKMPNTV